VVFFTGRNRREGCEGVTNEREKGEKKGAEEKTKDRRAMIVGEGGKKTSGEKGKRGFVKRKNTTLYITSVLGVHFHSSESHTHTYPQPRSLPSQISRHNPRQSTEPATSHLQSPRRRHIISPKPSPWEFFLS
jgi:hypothetical protein